MQLKNGIYCGRFAVVDKPYSVFEWDLPERNLRFIRGLDAGYYAYLARTISQNITEEDQQRAAVALRIAYSHGLESLFALLFAALQAPDCTVAWLLKYRREDIVELANRIGHRQRILSKLKFERKGWPAVAIAMFSPLFEEEQRNKLPIAELGKTWGRFASEFLDQEMNREYNNLKHGFRVTPGGFTMSFGLQEEPDKPAPADRMTSLGGSRYGSSYFVPEQLNVDANHFRIRNQSRNWVLQNMINGLQLITLSVHNIIVFLRVLNRDDTSDCQFRMPNDPAFLNSPWNQHIGVFASHIDSQVKKENIRRLSDEEILSVYRDVVE